MDNFNLIGAIVSGSFFGAVAGTVLKGFFDRRLAKKEPKTDRRAEAYKDFVIYFMTYSVEADDKNSSIELLNLNEIKSRLIVFGETCVVNQVSEFLASNQNLSSLKAKQEFCEVIRQMRKSVKTGAEKDLMGKIQKML